ncbi:MAG: class I SAM-dependent methyltransferase [Hyphomicrobiaceae bacterium]
MPTAGSEVDPNAQRLISAARAPAEEIGAHLDRPLSVKLWDGSMVPLGRGARGDLAIVIRDPGALPSLLRWPTLDRLIRLYAHGHIDFEGGTLIDIGEALGGASARKSLRGLKKSRLARLLYPFLLAPGVAAGRTRDFAGDAEGRNRAGRDEKRYMQFHYDVGNAFYALFLDAAMVYTCAYFTDWSHSIDKAQFDKLEMICRKLRLAPGDRMLDIGCGWGGLICHAAKHHGVTVLGVTLAEEQFAYAQERIRREGLEDRVRVELKDYRNVEGTFDKISSIGMYEAIGVAAVPEYLTKVRSLLSDDGLFLNHGITRRSKKRRVRFTARPEQRALVTYIFPGGELDDIGNTIAEMERHRFEVHDVEGWREHYAQTTKLWCERLTARRAEAVALVGEETTRIWLAYLAGCSLAFTRGTATLYQTLASKRRHGRSPLPPTRADLYR